LLLLAAAAGVVVEVLEAAVEQVDTVPQLVFLFPQLLIQ
jgi:hypothetical protein